MCMKTETERRLDAALAEAEALSHIIDVRTRALEAAEAEVARLTAEKDKIGDANCAVKMRLQLQVEALTAEKERALAAYDRMNAERIEERDKAFAAEALVEAGLGLADEWQGIYDRWVALHPDFQIGAGDRYGILRAHANRLRDVLGGAK